MPQRRSRLEIEDGRRAHVMPTLHIELGFFAGDVLLARGRIICMEHEGTTELSGVGGHVWTIKARYEEPASPVELECRRDGQRLYLAALQVGTHDSDDWESINLADIHMLAFRCRVDEAGAGRV